VSFKPNDEASSHRDDVKRLRKVISNPELNENKIIHPSKLALAVTDSVNSAFNTLGYDFGVPPVIVG
jgi:hypothetical protein